MRHTILRPAVVVGLTALAGIALVGPASAASAVQQVQCGQVITTNTTLANDVGPCSGNGIVLGADNITLNLNGHRVFGTSATGEGAGILLTGRRGDMVKNGTVSGFDAGVVISGGAGNTVSGITARDNIGDRSTDFGDGIAIMSSSNNLITNNTVVHNGPYDGIGLFEEGAPTTRNRIQNNTVLDNNICSSPGRYCDDDGIRLEPGVQGNFVIGNTVRGSALDGISLFFQASNNQVERNIVENNGFHNAPHRKGDGIRVFSDHNIIRYNQVFDNAANGIGVGVPGADYVGVENRITNNKTGGNVLFDLSDAHSDCDHNIWFQNSYDKANPPCTTNR